MNSKTTTEIERALHDCLAGKGDKVLARLKVIPGGDETRLKIAAAANNLCSICLRLVDPKLAARFLKEIGLEDKADGLMESLSNAQAEVEVKLDESQAEPQTKHV